MLGDSGTGGRMRIRVKWRKVGNEIVGLLKGGHPKGQWMGLPHGIPGLVKAAPTKLDCRKRVDSVVPPQLAPPLRQDLSFNQKHIPHSRAHYLLLE